MSFQTQETEKPAMMANIENRTECKNDSHIPVEPVPLPPGLQRTVLTVEQAEIIEKLLDDPNEPTYSGVEVDETDYTAIRRS